MIRPTNEDIGREVFYRRPYIPKGEYGIITSFNDDYVFVRYQKQNQTQNGQATRRSDLEWSIRK